MLASGELNSLPAGLFFLACAAFVAGGLLCAWNFRLFLAWLIHRLGKRPEQACRNVSGIPILGSLIVFLMLRTLGSIPAIQVIGIVLIAIDMNGIHWILFGLLYGLYRLYREKQGKNGA